MTLPTKFPVLALVAGLALLATGCAKPAAKARETAAEPAPSRTNEAAKTRELEDKAASYEERYREIQGATSPPSRRRKRAGALVDEQQRTVREAEDGRAGESEADPQQ